MKTKKNFIIKKNIVRYLITVLLTVEGFVSLQGSGRTITWIKNHPKISLLLLTGVGIVSILGIDYFEKMQEEEQKNEEERAQKKRKEEAHAWLYQECMRISESNRQIIEKIEKEQDPKNNVATADEFLSFNIKIFRKDKEKFEREIEENNGIGEKGLTLIKEKEAIEEEIKKYIGIEYRSDKEEEMLNEKKEKVKSMKDELLNKSCDELTCSTTLSNDCYFFNSYFFHRNELHAALQQENSKFSVVLDGHIIYDINAVKNFLNENYVIERDNKGILDMNFLSYFMVKLRDIANEDAFFSKINRLIPYDLTKACTENALLNKKYTFDKTILLNSTITSGGLTLKEKYSLLNFITNNMNLNDRFNKNTTAIMNELRDKMNINK